MTGSRLERSRREREAARFKLGKRTRSNVAFFVILLSVCLIGGLPVVAAQSQTATVLASALNLRAGPGTGYEVLVSIPYGQTVTINNNQGGWALVDWQGLSGYVYTQYLNIAIPSAAGNTVEINSSGFSMGSSGDQVAGLQTALKRLNYFKANVTGYFGSITRDALLAFQKDYGLSQTGVAGLTELNLLICSNALPEQTIRLSAQSAQNASAVSGAQTDSIWSGQTVTLGGGKIGSGATVIRLSSAVSAGTVGSVSPGSGASSGAGSGTIIGGGQTAPGASAGASQTGGIELLNWFGDAERVLPRGAVFRVTDVRSGYSFMMKRTGGTNHADCEPVTAEDTRSMFAAYANKWSWDRHPIFIYFDNRWLAASMNGMPHGYDTLPYNGMDGQVCIHFVLSRTHDTNAVCPLHQAAIQEAYRAGLSAQQM